jgi:hypothetical protein
MGLSLYPATERQLSYVAYLLDMRTADPRRAAAIRERLADGTMDRQFASDAITYLKAQPKAVGAVAPEYPAERPRPEEVLSCGMYQTPDGIFRVHQSKESGRLYAKVLVLSFDDDKPHFDYAKGAIYHLRPEDRMTLEQAKAWGVETGICCVCGAFLTDPKSVAEGIGPVCVKGFYD